MSEATEKVFGQEIKDTLAETQHRFELYDPFAETTFRFSTADAATAKADELGATRFQHLDANASVKQVDKIDGQWWVRNDSLPPNKSQQAPVGEDKLLADVQEAIDRDSLRAIEARAVQRAAAGQGFDLDKEMALADAHAFRRIRNPGWQESAAVEMANNARQFPEYKEGLEKVLPGYPGTATKVYALDAANSQKIAEKESRKAAEYRASIAERKETVANWSPERAASEALVDVANYRVTQSRAERAYMRTDIARNAIASPYYLETLNMAGADVAGEVRPMELKSMPGHRLTFNSLENRMGAEIVTPDDRLISFRDRPALEQFIAENNLTPEEGVMLRKLDAAADSARAMPRYPEFAPANASGAELDAAAGLRMTADLQRMAAAREREAAIMSADLARLAAARERDAAEAREALGLNTVEPSADRRSGLANNEIASDDPFTTAREPVRPVVPPEIESRFVRVGDKYFHPKNTELVAFEDKGDKLETKANSEAIADAMVRIAEARGWHEIKVSGTENFRREVWLEATARGLSVKGYTPAEEDKAALIVRERELDTNAVRDNSVPERSARRPSGAALRTPGHDGQESHDPAKDFRGRENPGKERSANSAPTSGDRGDSPVRAVGELVAHGPAKYLHQKENSESYFVTTRDAKGEEKTSWGVDLGRAVTESGAKVGDQVSLLFEGRKLVTITAPVKDAAGNVVGEEEKQTHRNTWTVQRAEAFAREGAGAAKAHPELAGAVAAEAAINKSIDTANLPPAARAVVSAIVRENIVNSIERGDLPQMNIREEVEAQRGNERSLEPQR